jgi:ankyrin repeat protein
VFFSVFFPPISFLPLASAGHTSIARLLLDQGASPSVQAKNGCTALDIASMINDSEVVRLLAAISMRNPNPLASLSSSAGSPRRPTGAGVSSHFRTRSPLAPPHTFLVQFVSNFTISFIGFLHALFFFLLLFLPPSLLQRASSGLSGSTARGASAARWSTTAPAPARPAIRCGRTPRAPSAAYCRRWPTTA